jgi:hypothetical protein
MRVSVISAKWSLGTRSWSESQSKVNDLKKRLKDFAEGKVVPKGTTVEAVLQEWYEFRDQNKLDNTKAKLLGSKLVEWCEKNDILLLTACQLMRETAMALVDAVKYGMSHEDAQKYGLSKPERRPIIQASAIRQNRPIEITSKPANERPGR